MSKLYYEISDSQRLCQIFLLNLGHSWQRTAQRHLSILWFPMDTYDSIGQPRDCVKLAVIVHDRPAKIFRLLTYRCMLKNYWETGKRMWVISIHLHHMKSRETAQKSWNPKSKKKIIVCFIWVFFFWNTEFLKNSTYLEKIKICSRI